MTDRGKVTHPDGSGRDLGELQLVFPCPCGQEVHVFELGILHALPMCADFEEMDPHAYLRHVRILKERGDA